MRSTKTRTIWMALSLAAGVATGCVADDPDVDERVYVEEEATVGDEKPPGEELLEDEAFDEDELFEDEEIFEDEELLDEDEVLDEDPYSPAPLDEDFFEPDGWMFQETPY